MLKNIIKNFKRYSFLMAQMINRDFKVKYKRSQLGILWSLLYPVLMMAVMALVFSNIFKFKVEGVNYLVYLMIGNIMFNYFNEASTTAMHSVINNFSLINKVYIPKYIFPLCKCLFTGINFLLTLIPLFVIILVTGSGDTKCVINIYYLLIPYAFICMFIFTVGMGFILSCIAVFFKDILHIYGIIITIWTYFTPIFYDISMLPENLQKVFVLNPLYQFITFVRTIILHGQLPSLSNWIGCGLSAIIVFAVGSYIFKKNQDKFIYYV